MNEIQLLQRANNEIKRLRDDNKLMSARLDMFDTMLAILHTNIATKNEGGGHPDIVFEIDEFLTKP